MRVLVWIIITLSSLKAQPVIIRGKTCPTVSGTPNFDLKAYLGQWFQLTALPFGTVNTADTCVWAKYALLPNGNVFVNNSEIDNGVRSALTGEAAPIANASGELDVEFFRKPSPTAKPNYYVLDTDYTQFTNVWGCENLVDAHTPMLWILNREYNRTAQYINEQANDALDILRGFGYDTESINIIWRRLVATDQTNCDYNLGHKGAYKQNRVKSAD